jgi:single-strand DNA-binding protein
METEGVVRHIYDERRINDNFKIREFVVTVGQWSPYPQHVIFQAVNNAMIQLLDIYAGDQVKISFNLRGKYGAPPTNGANHTPFNRLEVWRIQKACKE